MYGCDSFGVQFIPFINIICSVSRALNSKSSRR